MIGMNLLLSIVLSVFTGKNIATEPSFTFVPQIGHLGSVRSVAISPDGEFIVSGSEGWDDQGMADERWFVNKDTEGSFWFG